MGFCCLNDFCIFNFFSLEFFGSFQYSILCIMGELAGGESVAVAVGVSDKWYATCDMWRMTHNEWHMTHDTCHMTHNEWHMTHDTCHMTFDTWHITHDMWHMTCDMWHATLDTWHKEEKNKIVFLSVRFGICATICIKRKIQCVPYEGETNVLLSTIFNLFSFITNYWN